MMRTWEHEPTVECRVVTPGGLQPAAGLAGPAVDRLVPMLEMMIRIRAFEEAAVGLSRSGESAGSVHPYVGQEAIAVGVCEALGPRDVLTSTHRGHGHSIARGADLTGMFAELLGREGGLVGGKGGSMHIADFAVGNLGANGIAGAGVPIAVGAALASRCLDQGGRLAVAFFGDGAANEGAVHEAMNLAAAFALPCIFVCENNGWAISVPTTTAHAQPHIALRAPGYGMPGIIVDGQDCTQTYAAAAWAVERARSGQGPTLIECKSYLYLGHSTFSQPKKNGDEIATWRAHDPIDIHTDLCTQRGMLTATDVTNMRASVTREVLTALENARTQPETPRAAMFEDVYAETT